MMGRVRGRSALANYHGPPEDEGVDIVGENCINNTGSVEKCQLCFRFARSLNVI
jgi:hypothetical protein